ATATRAGRAEAEDRRLAGSARSIGLALPGVERVIAGSKPLVEDETRRGCRGIGAEAALLDRHHDDDRALLVHHPAGVPGLVGVVAALRGARLAIDRVLLHVPALEHVMRRATLLLDGAAQAVAHDREIARVDLDLAAGLHAELLDVATVGVLDRGANVRLDD